MTATTTATSTVASTHAHSRQSRSRRAGPEPSARLADRRTQSRTAAVVIAAVSAAPARIWSQSRNVTGGFGVIPTSSTPSSATTNWTTSPHVVPAVRCRSRLPRRAPPAWRVSPSRSVPGTSGVAVGPGRRFPGGRDVTWWRPLLTPRAPTRPGDGTALCCDTPYADGSAGAVPGVAHPRRSARPATRRRRGHGRRQTKIAVPGNSAPRSGDHWPHTVSRPSGHSGSTRSSSTRPGGDDVADPVAQRAVVLDVGRRRRGVDLDVGRAVEVRLAARSARPGPGRRRTSSASGGSPRTPTARRAAAPGRPRASPAPARPRTAPRRTPSRPGRTMPSRERQPLGAGLHERHGDAGRGVERGGVPQHPAGEVERHRPRALAAQPARARRRAAADLQHAAPGDVAEQARVGLAQPLRAPDEVDVADVAAVLGEVVVGVGVPPARGWPAATRRSRPAGARPPPCRAAARHSVPASTGSVLGRAPVTTS